MLTFVILLKQKTLPMSQQYIKLYSHIHCGYFNYLSGRFDIITEGDQQTNQITITVLIGGEVKEQIILVHTCHNEALEGILQTKTALYDKYAKNI